jgi:hypothetical protein
MLFATPLVQAILAGRKSVTRRVVKPAPKSATKGRCPFGEVGDRIWVREKWWYRKQFYDRRAGKAPPFVYAADGEPEGAKFTAWKSSLHMPREACRIVLEITDMRAERIRSITAKDAIAEGCPGDRLGDPVGWFAEIWDEHFASRGYGWSVNPWVWVIQFEIAQVKALLGAEPTRSIWGQSFIGATGVSGV